MIEGKKFFENWNLIFLVNLFGPMQVTWIRSIYDLAGDTGASKTIWYGTERFLTKGRMFLETGKCILFK
jgi:hypothetical protein